MDTELTIIGAGVVGLAISAKLSETRKKVYLLERHDDFGQETSSRNSEVIHAGIYYAKDSLKAKLCVKGNSMLYEICSKAGIPAINCGKLIVATCDEELEYLEKLLKKAHDNGVEKISMISASQAHEMEPEVTAVGALFAETTGIIDTHSLMKHLFERGKGNGVSAAFGVNVTSIVKEEDYKYRIFVTDSDGTEFSYFSRFVINCAGLESDRLALSLGMDEFSEKSVINFCKGDYFSVGNGKNKFIKRLVYPVPEKENVSLGIHVTPDITGRLKLGPSAWFMPERKYDYNVDLTKLEDFYKSTSKYLPFLDIEDLKPELSGIRPKLQKPGGCERDFIIRNEKDNGYPGFINLVGIDSPGLTSSLAIAEYVNLLLE